MGLIEDLSEAERRVELCEADLDEATARLRGARSRAPELAHHRALLPEDRRALLDFYEAEAQHRQAHEAYSAARHRLDRLEDEFAAAQDFVAGRWI